MDKGLKPAAQLSSKQKRNKFIYWLAVCCLLLPILTDMLCRLFKVELPPAVELIGAAMTLLGIILFLFFISRPRQDLGIPAIPKSKARNRWRLLVSIMVLTYVAVNGMMVLFLIRQHVPLSEILTRQGFIALITIPVFAIVLCGVKKRIDKLSQSDTPEQTADKAGKE